MTSRTRTRTDPYQSPEPPDGRLRGLLRRVRARRQRFRPVLAERPKTWAREHRTTLLALGIPLVLVIAATAWNLQGWPGRVDEDEGTYVAEAWAIIYEHHLAPYTYWYDHPPLGWAQLAAYIWLTDGFARYASSIETGREFMLLVTAASSVLVYVFGRRLAFRPATAGLTVAMFGLSPLAVYYHRLVSLDNIGTLWLLAAMVAATSRRRSLGAAFWAGMFSAVALLSKETIAILLPVVFWLIWQQAQSHTRKWHLAVYTVTVVLLTAFYPLFAALRGELFPGAGHVSLLWAVWWQLLGRTGSGFLLTSGSGANGLLALWLGTDRWLLLSGLALAPPAFFVRRLRPLAFGLLLPGVMALTGGYLPYFYVTAMLPFAALVIGGVADTLWNPVSWHSLEWARRFLVITGGVAAVLLIVPQWGSALIRQAGQHGAAGSQAATAWVERHVPKWDVVVVDDYLWLDLKRAGMNPLWEQKMASDSESQGELRYGWRSVDYVVVTGQIIGTLATLPILRQAIRHSVPVASFAGGIVVRRVITGPAGVRDYDDAAHSGDRQPGRPAAGGLHQADGRRAAYASGGRAGPVHR
jgi:4-amino-4-deoxy-L-arabinose transferase-like glycosyltransferase